MFLHQRVQVETLFRQFKGFLGQKSQELAVSQSSKHLGVLQLSRRRWSNTSTFSLSPPAVPCSRAFTEEEP